MSIFIAGFFDSRLYAMSLTIRFITKLSKVYVVNLKYTTYKKLSTHLCFCFLQLPYGSSSHLLKRKKEQKTGDLNPICRLHKETGLHQEQACTIQDLGEMFGTSPSANQMNPMKTIMTTATQERGTVEVYFDRCRLLQRHIRTSTACSTVSMKY